MHGRPVGGQRQRMVSTARLSVPFYGWRVVWAACLLAAFGWGVGFYGPPVFLHAVHAGRGWPLASVSAAVTLHFLVGAVSVTNLPALYRRYGVAGVTKVAALSLGVGVCGWALAMEPWQLFAATLLSGFGWSGMSAAAINAIVSPWFIRTRPSALALAYNGGSIGGVIFSPLWVATIEAMGFPLAAATVGAVMAVTVWVLADALFSKSPQQMGLAPDGDAVDVSPVGPRGPEIVPLPGRLMWRDVRFLTLAAAMAVGLFAQVGLLAHLFSLLVPALDAPAAGLAMAAATAAAVAGRTVVAWFMPAGADRRLVASGSYAVQTVGSLALLLAAGSNVPLLLVGVILFGVGIGNATSLPPLIAQAEFAKEDVLRVVALIVGIAQGTFAFAPAAFGLMREWAPDLGAPSVYVTAALLQALAIVIFLVGRTPRNA
jgi:MFS transporter